MRRRCSIVVVLVSVLVAATSSWPAARSAEGPRPRKTSYTVLSRTGGAVRVAALEWIPYRAKTVLLAVHGAGAVKENSWGPLVVPGYSLALHRFDEGRATVAIDLPGNGESEGNIYLSGIEDYAFVLDQIVEDLRARFTHVVGVGHSLGAEIVNFAQGAFASFDAIIPAAFSHGGMSAEFMSTCGRFNCPNARKILFTSYADTHVVEDFVSKLRRPKPTQQLNIALVGRPEVDFTSRVSVPVLLVLGKEDWVFDTSNYADEPSRYSSSPDVKLVVLPRTGHAVFHHLNHRYVNSVIRNWLAKHKL